MTCVGHGVLHQCLARALQPEVRGKDGPFKPLLTSDLSKELCHSISAWGVPVVSSCMGTETLQDIWLFSVGLQPASKHTHLIPNARRDSLTETQSSALMKLKRNVSKTRACQNSRP